MLYPAATFLLKNMQTAVHLSMKFMSPEMNRMASWTVRDSRANWLHQVFERSRLSILFMSYAPPELATLFISEMRGNAMS